MLIVLLSAKASNEKTKHKTEDEALGLIHADTNKGRKKDVSVHVWLRL